MITMKVETITPEKAAEYLQKNTNNYRKLSRSVAARYADDIKNGRWELNGESIVFDEDGILKNGQHRLAGIIMAKTSAQITVIRGVSRTVTIHDMGCKRSVGQIVSSQGVDCNSTVAAAGRIIACRFRTGLGNNETLSYLEKNLDELNRAYRIACSGGNSGASHNAPCVAGCYLMLRNDLIRSYEAELFFRLFNSNGMAYCDGYDPSPVLVARKMFNERGTTRIGGYQIQKERLEIVCLAMRDFSLGNERKIGYRISEPFFYEELMDHLTTEKEDL